jgi:hypothetical protein
VCLATLLSPSLLFFTSSKKTNKKHFNFFFFFFTFYITSIIFYYYSNKKKKNLLQNKTFSLFYKSIPNFFIFYITLITSYYYSNKNFTTQRACLASSSGDPSSPFCPSATVPACDTSVTFPCHAQFESHFSC